MGGLCRATPAMISARPATMPAADARVRTRDAKRSPSGGGGGGGGGAAGAAGGMVAERERKGGF